MTFGQFLGAQQVGDPELFAVGTGGAGRDVQHALGIGDQLRPLPRRARLGGSLILPEKLGGLIQQRDVCGCSRRRARAAARPAPPRSGRVPRRRAAPGWRTGLQGSAAA